MNNLLYCLQDSFEAYGFELDDCGPKRFMKSLMDLDRPIRTWKRLVTL